MNTAAHPDSTPVTRMGTCPHCGHDGEDFYDNREDEYAYCYRCGRHSLSFFRPESENDRALRVVP